jgi:threonine/homoserine/homoserine lactone efflux protein
VLSSGLSYGFCRTVPHVGGGVTIGFAFTVAAVGPGFGTIFLAHPVLQSPEICGHCLVYPAFAIASFGPPKPGEVDARGPISFWRAAIRQWVNNVKGRVMVIGTIAAYAAIARCPLNVAVQSVLCLPQAAVSTSLSTLFGSAARGRS